MRKSAAFVERKIQHKTYLQKRKNSRHTYQNQSHSRRKGGCIFVSEKQLFLNQQAGGKYIHSLKSGVAIFPFSAYYFLNSKQGHFAPTGSSSNSRPLVSVAGASPPKTPESFQLFMAENLMRVIYCSIGEQGMESVVYDQSENVVIGLQIKKLNAVQQNFMLNI